MKKFKIVLMLSILLLCFGFILTSEVHAQGDGPKVFEVGDVLPATTQLRISWISDVTNLGSKYIRTNINQFDLVSNDTYSLKINGLIIYSHFSQSFTTTYTNYDGDHPYIDIDTSTWDINKRTVSTVFSGMDIFRWEELAPTPSGYTITFEENGGTTQTDLTGQTNLPNPLPIPTKDNHTFLGWFYDSDFTNEAFAGDPLTSDVTLYAKWDLTNEPKIFEVGDVLPAGYIKISWDYNGLSFGYTDESARIVGTNGFIINILYDYTEVISEIVIQTCIMGDCFYTGVDNTTIKLDTSSVITEFMSEIENMQEHIFWEVVTVDEYALGYDDARDKFGYYDPITQRWLSVEEYLDLYGYEKMGQTDFYNNFDKYFIPAMIIVFGGAIVLTVLKVFKGRE